MERIAVPGAELAVDVAGEGPTVLLLHERFCTHRVFGPLRQALGDELRIIAPDLRGYGASQPPPRDFPGDYPARDTADVAALIRALAAAPVRIIGWGDGGVVAVRLAAGFPDLVASVVVMGAFPTITEETAPLWDMALEDNVIESVITDFFVNAEGNTEAAGRPFRDAWLECVEACLDTVYDGRGDFFLQDLPLVRSPLLFLDGSKDPFLTEGLRALVAGAMPPSARSVLLPGGPHELPLTHAHQVAGIIREFWSASGG